jgi:predicted nucleotidyltransferase
MITTSAAANSKAVLTEIFGGIDLAEAAALYGSVARGDMEPHSDIDLLVLCRSGQKRALIQAAEAELVGKFDRLSLAIYSHQEISFLHRSRSLFLLHLKREADILFERGCFLSTVLSQFQAKPSYQADLCESFALLDPLRTRVVGSPNDFHRLSYIYSLFRVFGVYLLADRGVYEFSKSKMAAHISQEYPLASDSIARLSELRVLNANFFSGGSQWAVPTSLTAASALRIHLRALTELTGRAVDASERAFEEAVQEFVAVAASVRGLNYRLRTWFLLLVYDGLNLYCKMAGLRPIQSFEPSELERVASPPAPDCVVEAVRQALQWVRDYRLKYFLNKSAKIDGRNASRLLLEFARFLSARGWPALVAQASNRL